MEIINYLGVSHAIFGFALLLAKRPKHISNVILAIWILLLGFVLMGRIIHVPVISFFKPGIFPIFLCFGPFLYLYIKSLTHEKFHFSNLEFLHFVPFIVIIIHRSFSDPVNFGRGGGHDFRNHEQVINFVYYCLTTISLSAYTMITFTIISKHKSNLKNIYSYKSSRYTLNWISAVSVMFLLVFTLSFIAGAFNSISADVTIPYRIQFVGSVFFILTASFFGANQPVILIQSTEEKSLPSNLEYHVREKYQRSGLSKSDMLNIEERVLSYLKDEKPYLNPEYNINLLSIELGIPRHHITQVINSNLNKNFYSMINELRIEEVIGRMTDSMYSHFTLLAIALDSGFNSKSAFNRAFKQTMGKTPSEYKSSIPK